MTEDDSAAIQSERQKITVEATSIEGIAAAPDMENVAEHEPPHRPRRLPTSSNRCCRR